MSAYSGQMSARSTPPLYQPLPTTNAYCSIPQRLLTDLHDTPLAIGLYALIARLHLVAKAPVPLSRADVLRFDPSLKAGAVKRAFDRLVDRGWLIEIIPAGRNKHQYTPSWGRVHGAPLPWRLDQPCHGRPRHVSRLPLDRSLFDICMGKLTPHATISATITRYVTTPVLSLADIGCYALTLADIPHETPALRRLGVVRNGQALPLLTEEHLLALISQRPLVIDDTGAGERDTKLTLSGTRRLGVVPLASQCDTSDCPQPLFFVPPGLIGSLIPPLIGSMIGSGTGGDPSPTAAASAKPRSEGHTPGITWESRDQGNLGITPPNPPQSHGGGGMEQHLAKGDGPAREERPDTETASALRAISVRPHIVAELADQPIELVRAVIADGRGRSEVRDLAGWVVALVRDARDHGWRVPCADDRSALNDADRQASFAQAKAAGLFVADDTLPATGQNQVIMPDLGQDTTLAEAPSGEATPVEDLTMRLQWELRTRTYPDLHPIIAGLAAHDDGMTLTLRCASPAQLAPVRARLLPLIGPVLRELGCARDLRLTTAACIPPPSTTKEEGVADRRAPADELTSPGLGGTRGRPHATRSG